MKGEDNDSNRCYHPDDIWNAKTVEAIPVEWLLNHIPHDKVMYEYNRKLIDYLVIGWRKENETDNLHECGRVRQDS